MAKRGEEETECQTPLPKLRQWGTHRGGPGGRKTEREQGMEQALSLRWSHLSSTPQSKLMRKRHSRVAGSDKELQGRVEKVMMELWAKSESRELWDLMCLVYAGIEVISERTLHSGESPVSDPDAEPAPMELEAPIPDSFGQTVEAMETETDPYSNLIPCSQRPRTLRANQGPAERTEEEAWMGAEKA